MKLYKILVLVILIPAVVVIFYFFCLPIYKEKFKKQEITLENINIETPKIEQKVPKTRQELMAYIEKNINTFIAYSPTGAENWQIIRFGFESDENVYVELEDAENLIKILFSCKKYGENFDCKNILSFEPENFKWKAAQGDDPFQNRKIDYYEKKDGIWKLIGLSEKLIFFPISANSLLEIQKTVDKSYLEWRKDPVSVLRHDLPKEFNFDINKNKFKPVSGSNKEGKIIYRIGFKDSVWDVMMAQPVKRSDDGIWVIERMKKVK